MSCRGLVVARGGTHVLTGVDLDVEPGTLTVLAGPSGVGKTTLLRALAGLEPLVDGRIVLAGRALAGTPTHRRRIAYVFQTPRLFPNLDVAENVSFALRIGGMAREERRARAQALLAEVGLDGFGPRSPRGLSGGEAQRVALARALSGAPDLLLLDEPLASVDPDRREALRRLIGELQRERAVTTLYVTHDQAEAAELGDKVALMLGGSIAQHGSPQALFERPQTPEVARFFGSRNLLRGTVVAGTLAVGRTRIDVPGPDGEAAFTIRPERVRLAPSGPLRARVERRTYLGAHVRLNLRLDDVELEALVAPDQAPAAASDVALELPAAQLWRFPHADVAAATHVQVATS